MSFERFRAEEDASSPRHARPEPRKCACPPRKERRSLSVDWLTRPGSFTSIREGSRRNPRFAQGIRRGTCQRRGCHRAAPGYPAARNAPLIALAGLFLQDLERVVPVEPIGLSLEVLSDILFEILQATTTPPMPHEQPEPMMMWARPRRSQVEKSSRLKDGRVRDCRTPDSWSPRSLKIICYVIWTRANGHILNLGFPANARSRSAIRVSSACVETRPKSPRDHGKLA